MSVRLLLSESTCSSNRNPVRPVGSAQAGRPLMRIPELTVQGVGLQRRGVVGAYARHSGTWVRHTVIMRSSAPWWALLSSAAAPVLLIGGWTLAAQRQPE